ncbi:hypothetical protein [Cellulosilyticum sp. I15G10I2]|uniref:hypothetical protein n=1 Tax=Cellulosilyticum sp. I15G10I2 TaxID=1892843 RepID=UPI00085C8A72|nr:hypothetical protein [Cellulosilyticum sp. I15G10I2]
MQYDEVKSKERLARIESKKISRILQNEYRIMRRIMVMSILLLVLIVIMFTSMIVTGNEAYQSVYVVSVIVFMLYMVFTLNQLENRKFMKLYAHDRRFYILSLFKKNIQEGYKANKHKLWSLTNAFIKELYLVQLDYKGSYLFSVQSEEFDIDFLSKAFAKKIKGLVLEEKNKEEIIDTIDQLLSINQFRNNDILSILDIDETNEALDREKQDLFEALNRLPESDKKIDILGLEKMVSFLKRINIDVLIAILGTGIVLGIYLLLISLLKEEFSTGMFLSLLLMAPTCVAVILNMLRKDSKY